MHEMILVKIYTSEAQTQQTVNHKKTSLFLNISSKTNLTTKKISNEKNTTECS